MTLTLLTYIKIMSRLWASDVKYYTYSTSPLSSELCDLPVTLNHIGLICIIKYACGFRNRTG